MGGFALENNRLPDTPWHVGFVKKEEADPRRHKARCVHIRDGNCTFGKCGNFMLECTGSSHCSYYAESEEQWEQVYLNTRTAEEEEADTFKGTAAEINALKRQMNSAEKVVENMEKPHLFSGMETIQLKSIHLPKDYTRWRPDAEELNQLLRYYEEHHKMDKPIVVQLVDGVYCLKENYL